MSKRKIVDAAPPSQSTKTFDVVKTILDVSKSQSTKSLPRKISEVPVNKSTEPAQVVSSPKMISRQKTQSAALKTPLQRRRTKSIANQLLRSSTKTSEIQTEISITKQMSSSIDEEKLPSDAGQKVIEE